MSSQQYQDDPFGGPGAGMQTRFAFPPLTPVVKKLIIINASIYGIMLVVWMVAQSTALIGDALGLSVGVWSNLSPFFPVWQLLTYGFIHGLGPMHLLMNVLGLYFFGTMVEGTIGSSRFLFHYLAAIFVGGAAFFLWELAFGGNHLLVGASGGVFAMIVAAACFRPNQLVIFIMFPIPLKWLAGGLVALDFIHGALSMRAGASASGDTAHLVHLVGAAYGFLAVRKRWIWRDPIQRVQVRRAIADEEKRQSDAQRMDALLEKIHKQGINSLDRREREFLKRVSAKR